MVASSKLRRTKGDSKNATSKKRSTNSGLRNLTAQNRELRRALRMLEKERDFFRDAVHAWAKKTITRKEMETLVKDYRRGLSLQDFIDDLEKRVLEAS